MAWYFIFLNLSLSALVVGVICGLHAWAISTQHRDWPQRGPQPAPAEPTHQLLATAELAS
jgi:hypothetical protein